jgi:3-hydroxyisobutyrate dehydrogenase-like beta-hydroxyacid dehydrogenase
MAERMIQKGLRPALWARRPQILELYSGADATLAASPAGVAASSDVIGLCLYDGQATDEVVFGPDGIVQTVRPGSVIAVHSTVGPDYVKSLAGRLASYGAAVVDAPVSGGPAAATGQLLVITGGSESDLEACAPMFATYSNRVIYVGAVGAAQAAKLVNNSLMTAITGLVFDAFDLGSALGIDHAGLGEILAHGSAANPSVAVYMNLGAEQFSYRAWPTLHKDVSLVQNLGFDTPLLIQAAATTIAEMERRRTSLVG